MSDSLLTVKETAEYLGLSTITVYRYAEKSELPYIRKRFGLRFRKDDLDDWLNKDKRKAVSFTPIFPESLTSLPPIVIDKAKGGKSKLVSKKGQTCFNYGFGRVYVRTYRSGHSCWTIDFRNENGKRIQKALANVQSREEAVFALRKKVAEIFNKKNGIERRKESIGFREFAKIYLEDYMMTVRRNFKPDVYRLQILCRYFKNVDLRIVTPLVIERFRKSRLKAGNTKSTCNRYLQLLKRMFNVAIEEGYAEENPVRKVKFFSEKDNMKERTLTDEEERKLMIK